MQVLIVRHAIAEDRMVFAGSGQSDDRRPLTDAGRAKMRKAAKGLGRVMASLDLIVSSPLTRARETADLLAGVYPLARQTVCDELSPGGSFAKLNARLQEWQAAHIALVGHEPDLSELTAWFAGAKKQVPFTRLKKGSALLLEFEAAPKPGTAVLRWALTPKQLRALAGEV